MNDYKFGELIYKSRTKNNMSQAQLAKEIGVTDKAVSKWETGKSKPQVDTLKKLARVLNISIEKLLDIPVKAQDKQITKIVMVLLTYFLIAEIKLKLMTFGLWGRFDTYLRF